jgi:PAS domain-containing protein
MIEYISAVMSITAEEVINHPIFLVNAFDQHHRVLFWNKKCEQYFSISPEQAINEILEDLVPHARNNPKMKLLDKALSGKTVFVAEDKYDRKDGLYTQIVLPLKNESGEVVAAVNIVSDVPQPFDRRRLQRFQFLTYS